MQFGIARAIYAMRSPWLQEGDADSELRRNRKGRLVLDHRTDEWCRGRYEAWLSERGVALFGEPLDHGDDQRVPEQPEVEGGDAGERQLAVVDAETGSEELADVIDRSPYSAETVGALAALVHQADSAENLDDEQRADLRLLIEVAERAAISDETMRRDARTARPARGPAHGGGLAQAAPDRAGERAPAPRPEGRLMERHLSLVHSAKHVSSARPPQLRGRAAQTVRHPSSRSSASP